MPSQFRTAPKDRTRSRSYPRGSELPIAIGTGSPTRVTERAQASVLPTRPSSALLLRTDVTDQVPTGRATPFPPPRTDRRCPHIDGLPSRTSGEASPRPGVGVAPRWAECTDVVGANACWTEAPTNAGAVTEWSPCAGRPACACLVMVVSSRGIRWRRATQRGPRDRFTPREGPGRGRGRSEAPDTGPLLRRRETWRSRCAPPGNTIEGVRRLGCPPRDPFSG